MGRYLLVLVFLALGLMSKPSVVTLPFVLLLLDYWPLGRLQKAGSPGEWGTSELKRALYEKLPMLLLVAGASVITIFVQRAIGFVSDLERLSLGLRVSNAVESYAIYLWKTIFPTDLAAFYPHPEKAISSWSVAAAGLVLPQAVNPVPRPLQRSPLMSLSCQRQVFPAFSELCCGKVEQGPCDHKRDRRPSQAEHEGEKRTAEE